MTLTLENSPPIKPSAPWPDKFIERGVLFLLIFTPLAFGTVQEWSIAVMEIAAFTIFGVWLYSHRHAPRPPWDGLQAKDLPTAALVVFSAIFVLLVVLQVVPMPRNLLDLLSPKTAELYRTYSGGDQDSWRTISMAPQRTLSHIVLFLSYLAVFIVVLQHYAAVEKIRGLFRSLIIIGCSFAVLAVLTRVFGNGNVLWVFPVTAGENAMGPYINKNHFAGYMEMIIPIALSYYLYTAGKIPLPSEELANSRVRQALFFLENKRFSSLTQGMAAVLLLTGALFMTLSRGGILGYAVSMAVFAWLISVRRSLRKRIVFMALLGGIVALAVITAGWRMFETRFEVAVQQGDKRLDAWQDSRSLARDFPVFGTGWGAFGSVFPLYQTRHAALRFEHPENEYIEVLAETGGAGLVLLLAAVAALSWKLVRRWRDRHNTFVVCFGVGGFAAFTAIAVHSLTDFNMRVPANALLMTVIVALTCAALFKVPSRRKNSAEKA